MFFFDLPNIDDFRPLPKQWRFYTQLPTGARTQSVTCEDNCTMTAHHSFVLFNNVGEVSR